VPVVEFRASIVIGAGSLSFEMIRALVERLPAMICPRWVDTRTQPIAIDDVLAYLRAALDLAEGREGVFEIGGPEVVSYGDMMREYAKLRGLRRVLLPVPLLTPRLSGLWLGLVTPAQARVGRALVEGLRNSTVVRSAAAIETFAIRPRTLREAFMRAIDEGGRAQLKTDSRLAVVDAPPAQAFAPIRRIGGGTGWYFADALWRLRGWIDVGVGGLGMPRTRRDREDCVVGDVIDGWRVEAYEPDRLLRLSAGLKLPGRGWLEFSVDPLDGGARSLIRQTATFDPRGVAGRLYWYGVLPLHALVFRGLLRRIAQRAVRDTAPGDLSRFTYSSIASLGPSRTLYKDRTEFAVSRRRALNRLAAAVLKPLLRIAFAHRHRVVRAAIVNARQRVARAASIALVAATTLQPAAAPAQTPPVRVVPFVDLDRYAGDWFEVARFPNRFQRQCVGDVRATYARRPDGRVDVVNRCRTAEGETEARGVARIVDERTFAKLKVRFAPAWLSWLPMVWGDYWIIGLAPDYSWAVVGDPGRDYLWILARAPHLDDASTAVAQAAARDNGFDVRRLVPMSQAGTARP
jgi:lipocalin